MSPERCVKEESERSSISTREHTLQSVPAARVTLFSQFMD
jgi:hypothetical protein